ncbi:hypothetical protein pEaSNUABM40_00170 [Erwinia phage pEa_SNUABM_40]|nr:hypothetical protein pEaSNUABM40_00170 [Erwinia phage pEa_SNUABM_40]UAW52950.1 hypothetical protein pEaSNUABM23_00168 [Erwinia phage pEa_SNUABM_23]UIW10846.1 hypothetical protein pEaSNUABM23_00168 [Erwinia phage pEa_SNUABM_31]
MNLHEVKPKPQSGFEAILRRALTEEGITLVNQSVLGAATATLDLTVNVSIEGAATSLIDATYEKLKVVGLKDVIKTFGNCLMLVSCDRVEVIEAPFGCPPSYIFKDCVFCVGKRPEADIQTTYLAMQGVYPDLPPYSQLTPDQKKMISNHIAMLADYLRK